MTDHFPGGEAEKKEGRMPSPHRSGGVQEHDRTGLTARGDDLRQIPAGSFADEGGQISRRESGDCRFHRCDRIIPGESTHFDAIGRHAPVVAGKSHLHDLVPGLRERRREGLNRGRTPHPRYE